MEVVCESLPFRCPVAKDQETAEDIGDCLILLMNNSLKANSPPTSLQNEQLNRVDFSFNSSSSNKCKYCRNTMLHSRKSSADMNS